MAERIELFQVTCPAGTALVTPQTTALAFDDGIVERIEVTVPTGPRGFMGFRLRHSQQVVIPYSGANWVVVNGANLDWKTEGYPTGSKWTVQMYNTDIFDHTIYIRLHVNEIPSPQPPGIVPFAIA